MYSSFFASKSKKKNSTLFVPLFFCRAFLREKKKVSTREKDYANDDDMPKQRCVVLPFVACVVSALVFARPARGFYLPGVAPQGTSLFLGLGSRRPLLVFIIFQRAFVRDDLSLESEFFFRRKRRALARWCLTSFLSLSQITRKTMSCS